MSFWNWTTRTALTGYTNTSTWSGPIALPVARPTGATVALIEVESTSGTANISGIRTDGDSSSEFSSRNRYTRREFIYLNPSDDNVNVFSSSSSAHFWLRAYTDHIVKLTSEYDISALMPTGSVQTVTLVNAEIPSDAAGVLVRVADAVSGRFGLVGTMGSAPSCNYMDAQTIIIPISGKQFEGQAGATVTSGQAVVTGYFKAGTLTQKSPAVSAAPVALSTLEELPFSFANDAVAILNNTSSASSHLYGVATTGGSSAGNYNAHVGNPIVMQASSLGKVSGTANNANVAFYAFAEIPLSVTEEAITDIDQLVISELTTVTLSADAAVTGVLISDGEYSFAITDFSQPTDDTVTFTPTLTDLEIGSKLGDVTVVVQTTLGDTPAYPSVLILIGYDTEILYSVLDDGYVGSRVPALTVGAQVAFPIAYVDVDSFGTLTSEYAGPEIIVQILDRSATDGLWRLHNVTLASGILTGRAIVRNIVKNIVRNIIH
jgi:hypothetical protein